jgi:hypothetical protein
MADLVAILFVATVHGTFVSAVTTGTASTLEKEDKKCSKKEITIPRQQKRNTLLCLVQATRGQQQRALR